ncbi:MAG: thioredoxin [Clostridia bacterium]|nr:thioredoxin [Clostridia bacterium]
MAEIKITAANFQEEVVNSEIPVLLDFWATWCGPCNMIAPALEEIAQEYEGKIKVGKVNVDEEGLLAAQFGVTGIPYVVLMKDGKIADSFVGYRSREEIQAFLK